MSRTLAHKQQNPPKDHKDTRYVRITHQGHALVGQVVKVVRQAGLAYTSELQWVLELDDKSRMGIPLSWAEPVTELSIENECSNPEGQEGWADAKAYLNLAKMIYRLKINQPEEVKPNESSNIFTYTASTQTTKAGTTDISGLEKSPPSNSTRTYIDVSQPLGEADSIDPAQNGGTR